MSDFLPRRDAKLVEWTRVFAQQIAVDPAAIGLTATQAADYAAQQAVFAAAYLAAYRPDTRGLATVRRKDETRALVVKQARELARIVRAHPGTTELDKLRLGLISPTTDEESGPGRASGQPQVKVTADSRRVRVTLRSKHQSKARPHDAVGAAVYWMAGETGSDRLADYTLAGNTTKPALDFILPESAATPGTGVWVTACWLNAQLQPGSAAEPKMTRVGFGYCLRKAA